jgi:hypothetical protein
MTGYLHRLAASILAPASGTVRPLLPPAFSAPEEAAETASDFPIFANRATTTQPTPDRDAPPSFIREVVSSSPPAEKPNSAMAERTVIRESLRPPPLIAVPPAGPDDAPRENSVFPDAETAAPTPPPLAATSPEPAFRPLLREIAAPQTTIRIPQPRPDRTEAPNVRQQAGDSAPAVEEPKFEIHIGRVEVIAVAPAASPTPAPRKPVRHAVNLDDYLKRGK